MEKFNVIIGKSSAVRFDRIQELLGEKKGNFTPADFTAMSRDSVAGPDNSIWRTGSTPTTTRTLATWDRLSTDPGRFRVVCKHRQPRGTGAAL
jgi:hypothetical protein